MEVAIEIFKKKKNLNSKSFIISFSLDRYKWRYLKIHVD